MLRQMLCWLTGAMLSVQACANDPFDKTRRHAVGQDTIAHEHPAAPCRKAADGVFPTIPFDQITIIGVLQQQNHRQLMLLADNQVSLAKQGDFIAAEQIQIDGIEKQSIRFLRRDNDKNCTLASPFNVKF